MLPIPTKNFISDLISAGADANKNLFMVTITQEGGRDVILPPSRVVNVTLPIDASSSINLDYQNIKIPIASPNTNIQRNLKFTVRESEGLEIYKFIKGKGRKTDLWNPGHMNISYNGEYVPNPDENLLEIKVEYFKSYINDGYEGYLDRVAAWTFHNCYIMDMNTSVTYDYDSAGGRITYPINVIFERMDTSF